MTERSLVRNALRGMAGVVVLTLALALPGRAQTPSVDELVRLALTLPGVRTMTADFDVHLSLRYGNGGLLTAAAHGVLNEWRVHGEPLHRKITIREIQLPFILQPFTGLIRRVIKERIETQPDDLPDFHAHDFFLLDGMREGPYVIGGVRQDIVTQAIARYGGSQVTPEDDADTRRAIAKWLIASPLMKSWIVRPGPPYALKAVVDEHGLLYGLTIFYTWGAVDTQITYALISGQPVWNRVQVDAAGELSTIGRVAAQATISLSNQCLDCATTWSNQGSRSGRVPTGRRSRDDQLEPVPAGHAGRIRGRRRDRPEADPARSQPARLGHPPRRVKTGDHRKRGPPGDPGGTVAPLGAAAVHPPRRYGPPPAIAVALSTEERTALERLCRAGTTERRLADRAQVVLLAAAGWGNALIATYLHRSRYWVQRWRHRFGTERLAGLSDRQRRGRRPKLPL